MSAPVALSVGASVVIHAAAAHGTNRRHGIGHWLRIGRPLDDRLVGGWEDDAMERWPTWAVAVQLD